MTEIEVALVDERNADAITKRLREGLVRYNESKGGTERAQSLVLSLTDDLGELVGGLAGVTFWNALHVELLWIADHHRGQGYGKRLMRAAESEGRSRGAEIAYLTTYSFQAPEFYERLGYRKFGEMHGVPPGATRIGYWKSIRANAV